MDEDVFDESNLFSEFDSVENGDENESLIRPKTKKTGSLTELDSIKKENMLLKKLLKKMSFNPSEVEPFANVLFYNSACSRQGDLEDFICHIARRPANDINASILPGKALSKRNALSDRFAAALGHVSNFENIDCEEEYDMSDVPTRCIQYFASFCLDWSGSDEKELFPKPPSYERVYCKTLPVETGGKVLQRRKTCFNCDGDHNLSECTKRRDLARISMKRKEFLESKTFVNESRYHQDQAKVDQYQHLKPGIISDELRKALNIVDHELPPFIYRMRMLGYPPGWLPVNHDSGIVMYGKEGKEEGSKQEQLDSEKYVHYPGFNVPTPVACKDMAHEIRLPVMQSQHQLDVKPVDELSENDSNKRKFSSEDEGSHKNKRTRSSSGNDMEVEDDEPEPPGTSNVIKTYEADGGESQENTSYTQTKDFSPSNEVEDGEIVDSPGGKNVAGQPHWWLKQPLVGHFKKGTCEFKPPPFPLTPLPLHKISQILPGDLNHISFEDRSRWLDPIFGNLQVRTGRFEKLKTILAARENKRKSV